MLRGNVVDLAVAVVIGTAFTALISAVTAALLKPLINLFLGGGVSGGKVTVRDQVFDFGAVINAAVTFLIIAAVIYYAVVVPLRHISKPTEPKPPEKEHETELHAPSH